MDEHQKLIDVQKAAQRTPLELVRPVITRWNTVYDAHCRLEQLKPSISAVLPLPVSDWEDLEAAVRIMTPLAVATDVCQADGATLGTVVNQLRTLPDHFIALGGDLDLREFSRKAKNKCDSRWLKHFESPAVDMVAFLDPKVDQATWEEDKRQRVWVCCIPQGTQIFSLSGGSRDLSILP